MTQQEQQLLNGLIERVNGTQLASKDADAEALLNSGLQRNPDALYVLCQTVLVQQFGMENAQKQLTAARAEIDALKQAKPEQHGSFLGNLFGLGKGDDAPAQQQNSSAPANSPNQPTGYAPVHNPAGQPYGYPQQAPPPPYGGYAQPGYHPGYGAPPMGGGMFGGGGGFMQGAMQTAAGVVAGEFAFRALEDVFHGFGGGGGREFGGGTEVVNNYYGDDASGSRDSGGFGDRLQSADGFGNGISPDIEDRRGDSQGFLGGNDDSGNDGAAFADDNGTDDNGSDDSGSFSDDSGSFDDGGGDSGGNDDNGF